MSDLILPYKTRFNPELPEEAIKNWKEPIKEPIGYTPIEIIHRYFEKTEKFRTRIAPEHELIHAAKTKEYEISDTGYFNIWKIIYIPIDKENVRLVIPYNFKTENGVTMAKGMVIKGLSNSNRENAKEKLLELTKLAYDKAEIKYRSM